LIGCSARPGADGVAVAILVGQLCGDALAQGVEMGISSARARAARMTDR
jgi:hypothetical protein